MSLRVVANCSMICVTMCKSALAGAVPVPARQFPTGTILVDSPAHTVGAAVAYCRVSSAEQRADLERQAGRVAEECGTRGITLAATITEIGSGVNGNPVTLRKLLADPGVSTIVVEHCDRLARFGVDHLEAALVGEVTSCSGGDLRRDSPMETHVRPAPCGQRVLPREDPPGQRPHRKARTQDTVPHVF